MEYDITPSSDGTFIIIRSYGEINRKIAVKQAKEAQKIETNIFLSDVREARNNDTVFNQYNFAYEDLHNIKDLITKEVVAAVLASPGDTSHDFIETVTRNAGYKFRLFTDEEKAIEYLNNSKKPDQSSASEEG